MNKYKLRKAIKDHCYWCCCEDKKEVKACPAIKCPCHPVRTGEELLLAESYVEIIKQRCFDCSGFDKEEVKNCTLTDCALYPYRMLGFKKKLQLSDEERQRRREQVLRVREERLKN